ncbi:hypothetical protein GQ53DRAFT_707923 [Thozetella sp. PMI_491]|nr:hypothetical protein GQ53DRAFT_707923 [Thozetella sp. PMI_491]
MADQDEQTPPGEPGFTVSNTSPPTRKRKRPNGTRSDLVYTRKRATAACRACRARKVKCNNMRPTCDSCMASNASCVYEDARDHSTFDPASILILDRLNQVLVQLGHLSSATTGHASDHAQASLSETTLATPESSGLHQPLSKSQHGRETPNELRIPSARTTPDAILRWPIFEDRFPDNYITDGVFTAELADEDLDSNVGGIDEDAIPELVTRFLELVHIKNPILDPEVILSYAYYASEEGLRWDPPSCLVLIVCALGCVAQPFPDDLAGGRNGSTSFASHGQRLQQGESYFGMARKRFGLLGRNLLAPQCHFLAGVYLMYTMQPLAAWSQFHSASMSYHIYLQCQARLPPTAQDPSQALQRRRREQRLYWSCYKSECELRTEMDLPNSSLADLDYPDMYPSPPDPDASGTSANAGSPVVEGSTGQTRPRRMMTDKASREESWFYYLTEITLRRIGNRIINAFYSNSLADWNEEAIPSMAKEVEEFERQLEEWYQRLPPPIQFEEDELPTRELQYMVQARVLELRTWMYRPFLYYAIHSPRDAPNRNVSQSWEDKAVLCCFRGLRAWPILHRHHGTWYSLRATASVALCVLGAAKCGTISLPHDWRETMTACIDRLRFWEDEGPAMSRTIQVLESYLYEMRDE